MTKDLKKLLADKVKKTKEVIEEAPKPSASLPVKARPAMSYPVSPKDSR